MSFNKTGARMDNHLIQDPHFRVVLDLDGSSPSPQTAIWRGQHQCVIEGFSPDDPTPESDRAGQIVIRHQLAGDRGHYSVLDQAFIQFYCAGFPHNVVAQITRHSGSRFLVQSSRYSGKRFVTLASAIAALGFEGAKDQVESVFYLRPVGHYSDRQGKRYEYTEEDREQDLFLAATMAAHYAERIERGFSEEHARGMIPYDFRQNFCMSGTVKDLFHWLDQRSKRDAQLEIQTLAAMVRDAVKPHMPELFDWYNSTRWGRAKLAP